MKKLVCLAAALVLSLSGLAVAKQTASGETTDSAPQLQVHHLYIVGSQLDF